MGLHVEVYRSKPFEFVDGQYNDCTNGGISSRADGLCLVNVEGPFNPNKDYPAAMLVDHRPFGDDVGRRLVRIVPAREIEPGKYEPLEGWAMFGGNYAGCSDGRFREACESRLGVYFYGAVPIHDRFE